MTSMLEATTSDIRPIPFSTRDAPVLSPPNDDKERQRNREPDERGGNERILVPHVEPWRDTISLYRRVEPSMQARVTTDRNVHSRSQMTVYSVTVREHDSFETRQNRGTLTRTSMTAIMTSPLRSLYESSA